MLKYLDLGGWWRIRFDDDHSGESDGWDFHEPDGTQKINLPSCWNEVFPERYLYDGKAWFFRDIFFCQDDVKEHVRINFEGVNYCCTVWVNGVFCGKHEGGFTSFSFAADNLLIPDTVNHFAILVDSQLSETTIPPKGVDWFNFGGIYRNFGLCMTGAASIKDYCIKTRLNGDVAILLDLIHDPGTSDIIVYEKIVDEKGQVVSEETFCPEILDDSEIHYEIRTHITQANLWNPGNPYLYMLTINLFGDNGELLDTLTKKFGVREFSIQGNKILINGSEVRLTGCAKHEDYPLTGRTVTREQLVKDYDLLRQMNANLVRLSHYPHNRIELDLLNELGIAAISEAPVVFLTAEQMNDPAIQEKCKVMIDELIHDEKNETCVMFWSLFIECETYSPIAWDCVKALVEHTHELDATRLVIMASNHPFKDDSYDLFDVVGINYWSGWYGGEKAEIGDQFFSKMIEKYPDKPLLITSHGWEGLYGERSRIENIPWSEDSQTDYLTRIADVYMNYRSVMGEIIWTFSDFRVSNWNDISTTGNDNIYLGRPMLFNHKGVVDHFRRPKSAYYAMQEKFSQWQKLLPGNTETEVPNTYSFDHPDLACKAAAFKFIDLVNELLCEKETINVAFSWNPAMEVFFEILSKNKPLLPWNRISVFQFDEICGVDYEHSNSFHLQSWLANSNIHLRREEWIDPSAADTASECKRYASMISQEHIDCVCIPCGAEAQIGFLDNAAISMEDTAEVIHFTPTIRQSRMIRINRGLSTSHISQIITLSSKIIEKTDAVLCLFPDEMDASVRFDLLHKCNAPDLPVKRIQNGDKTFFYFISKNNNAGGI